MRVRQRIKSKLFVNLRVLFCLENDGLVQLDRQIIDNFILHVGYVSLATIFAQNTPHLQNIVIYMYLVC